MIPPDVSSSHIPEQPLSPRCLPRRRHPMRRKSVFLVTLLFTAAPARPADTTSDALVAQALLGELRQLRKDLQTTAATIQRIQIVIHRLEFENGQLERDTQLRDQAQ